MNRNPQLCWYCQGTIEDAEGWSWDPFEGYAHELCQQNADEENEAWASADDGFTAYYEENL